MTDFSTARRHMVDGQVRTEDVTDLRVLEAMATVPREAFLPDHLRAVAYLDMDIAVGGEGGIKRYLLKPALIARMLQAAEIDADDRVLVVGCATGYAAAIVAEIAGEVFATESDSALASAATAALAQAGFGKVSVTAAPVADGDAAHAPYDVIVLCGATELFPERLCAQLKEGGRLVGVFATSKPSRAMLVTRSEGDFGTRPLFDATAPGLPGMQRAASFVF